MPNFSAVLAELQSERKKLTIELTRLDKAIGALRGLAVRGGSSAGRSSRRRPRLSPAARARIAAAQRARWAKVRQLKAKKAAA